LVVEPVRRAQSSCRSSVPFSATLVRLYTGIHGLDGLPSNERPRRRRADAPVAEGSAEALGLLHCRFARLIFGLAVPTLDRAATVVAWAP
jgi:hypothetical protein